MLKGRMPIYIFSALCIIFIFILIYKRETQLEYIETDTLCNTLPIFLASSQEDKFLLTFAGDNNICYREISNSTEYIAVNDDVITLFDSNKDVITSYDNVTHETSDENAQFTIPAIAYDDGNYTYNYIVDDVEHFGTIQLSNDKFELIDVN